MIGADEERTAGNSLPWLPLDETFNNEKNHGTALFELSHDHSRHMPQAHCAAPVLHSSLWLITSDMTISETWAPKL